MVRTTGLPMARRWTGYIEPRPSAKTVQAAQGPKQTTQKQTPKQTEKQQISK